MVVPLILLGTVTKLAFAVAVTHRTRFWWLPGALAMVLGAIATHVDRVPATAAEGAVVFGVCALLVGYLAGAHTRGAR